MVTQESALAQLEQTGRVGIGRSAVKSVVALITCLAFGGLFGWLFSRALPQATAPGATSSDTINAVVWGAVTLFFLASIVVLVIRFTRLQDRLVLTRTGFAVDGRPEHPWESVRGYGVIHQRASADRGSVTVESGGTVKNVAVPTDLTMISSDVIPLMQEVHRRALGR